MLKRIAAILAAMLLLTGAAALAEGEDDFEFGFIDDGYDGEWVSVGALGCEFCLPEGWTQTDAPDGAAYAAADGNGSATLAIRSESEDAGDLAAWGEAHLDRYEMDEANFYDALVVEEAERIVVRIMLDEHHLIAFDFTRADDESLSRAFALQIVGSVCVLWDADEVPFGEGDPEGDFDFKEAFEGDAS